MHPCRAQEDSGGNPRFKMHNCEAQNSPQTTCQLTAIDIDRVDGYTSVCPTCWPDPDHGRPRKAQEAPWIRGGGGSEGDVIRGRE